MIASGIKRGTAELAILSVLEKGPVHGYEIARQIAPATRLTHPSNGSAFHRRFRTSCRKPAAPGSTKVTG